MKNNYKFPKFESTPFACRLEDVPYCRLTCSLEERYLIENESLATLYGAAPGQCIYIDHPDSLYEASHFETDTFLSSASLLKEQLEELLAEEELDNLIEQQQLEELFADEAEAQDILIERNYKEGLADWLFTAILSLAFMLLFIWSNQADNIPLASFSLLASLFLWLAASLTHRAF
jgi:hypothetical protein